MHVRLLLDASTYRRWHGDLANRLRDQPGNDVALEVTSDTPTRTHRKLESLLSFERLIHRVGDDALAPGSAALPAAEDHRRKDVDVTIDLRETPSQAHWKVLYDDTPGEQAAVSALRSGRQPIVSVVDEVGRVRAQGRPGTELPGMLALSEVAAATATLIVGALAGSPFVSPAPESAKTSKPLPFSVFAAREVAATATRLIRRLFGRRPRWRVGWRFSNGPDLISTGKIPSTGWHDLPDDGRHWYADPFLYEHDGTTYLFVEDFDHRVGKGVISVTRMENGKFADAPRQVLNHEAHLSYPCVFGHADEIWMVPETSGANTVELYRAVEFPWKWELHSILLEDVKASDATPFIHDERWWMAATVGFGGSLSDTLSLWSAPELWGPWTPHKHNPVLVDVASARPAGHVHLRHGRLLRPVQDSRDGYGAAMAVAEITQLDDDGFDQKVTASYHPGGAWPGWRIHTFNSGGGIEAIDGSGSSR